VGGGGALGVIGSFGLVELLGLVDGIGFAGGGVAVESRIVEGVPDPVF